MLKEKGCGFHHHYRISWSAILAGAFVGIGLAFLLHLYGVAITLSAFSSSDGTTVTLGGLIGILIGVIASMSTAGFVAGYLGRYHYHNVQGGIIYGFICWSLILMLAAFIAGPLMHFATAYEKSLQGPEIQVNTSTTANNKSSAATVTNSNNNATVKVTSKDLAWGGWIIFGLFFVGALSSCVGACFGLGCKREEEDEI